MKGLVMLEYNGRKEVPEKYRFDLTDFYQNKEEWEEQLEFWKEKSKELQNYKGTLSNGLELENYLQKYIKCVSSIMDLYVYAMLNHDVDLSNDVFIDMQSKIDAFNTEFETANAFFEPEIVSMKKETYEKLFLENPKLSDFRVYLDEIYRRKEHTLSESEEKILSTLSETFTSLERISSTLINQEHDYGKIKMPDGNIIQIAANNIGFLKRNKSPKVRKTVSKQFGATISQYQNTESTLLHNYIKNSINVAKIRNFESPWQRKLDSIHISNEVFESLKESAKASLSSESPNAPATKALSVPCPL